MLAIRYNDPTGEMELIGNSGDLEELGERIRVGSCGVVQLNITGSPSPYSRFFRQIELRNNPGKVVLAVAPDRETLIIAGDRWALEIFGENIKSVARGAEGDYHLHVEYFEGHYYLSEESEPLVVSVI
jgi:hypothetical protein